MKLIYSIMLLFLIENVSGQQDTSPVIKKPENKIGSLKDNPTTPRHIDKEVAPSPKDKMPVIKVDTSKDVKMPVSRPREDQPMPIKNPSDSTKK